MIDVEKGIILHSAKMTLNRWSEYENKLPVFAADCVKKLPIKGAKTAHLRSISWAYPITMNAAKTEFSINVYPSMEKSQLTRITLSKIE